MMQKRAKLMVTRIVEEKGCFLIKEAANQLANKISVSRYNIYNYIEELKSKKLVKQNKK